MAWETQNHDSQFLQYKTPTRYPGESTSQGNPTHYGSAGPLNLDKGIKSMHMPSV